MQLAVHHAFLPLLSLSLCTSPAWRKEQGRQANSFCRHNGRQVRHFALLVCMWLGVPSLGAFYQHFPLPCLLPTAPSPPALLPGYLYPSHLPFPSSHSYHYYTPTFCPRTPTLPLFCSSLPLLYACICFACPFPSPKCHLCGLVWGHFMEDRQGQGHFTGGGCGGHVCITYPKHGMLFQISLRHFISTHHVYDMPAATAFLWGNFKFHTHTVPRAPLPSTPPLCLCPSSGSWGFLLCGMVLAWR